MVGNSEVRPSSRDRPADRVFTLMWDRRTSHQPWRESQYTSKTSTWAFRHSGRADQNLPRQQVHGPWELPGWEFPLTQAALPLELFFFLYGDCCHRNQLQMFPLPWSYLGQTGQTSYPTHGLEDLCDFKPGSVLEDLQFLQTTCWS